LAAKKEFLSVEMRVARMVSMLDLSMVMKSVVMVDSWVRKTADLLAKLLDEKKENLGYLLAVEMAK
jgi:hypothetical protein